MKNWFGKILHQFILGAVRPDLYQAEENVEKRVKDVDTKSIPQGASHRLRLPLISGCGNTNSTRPGVIMSRSDKS